jgi:(heptosyl)LPS beta-1,4-glucosyltransferase
MNVSVVIPVLNEAVYLPGCLASVAFAKEIIVVDSGSTDETMKIAKAAGAQVIKQEWQGFAAQKNVGATFAKEDWLLFVDADERVSSPLAKEIVALKPEEHTVYTMPRLNYILGKPMRHGGWYPDYQRRLVARKAFTGWQGSLHEMLTATPEKEGILHGDLIHLTHRGIDWMLNKSRIYAKKEADLYMAQGHPKITPRHFFTAPLREFYLRGLKHQGYRDGVEGWLEVVYQAFNAFLIKAFIFEAQQSKSMETRYRELDERIDHEL